MSRAYYNKLVRDRIPERIQSNGGTYMIRRLAPHEHLPALDAKLREELDEYLDGHDPEELADLLEVIFASAEAIGCSREKLEQFRQEKLAKAGGFEEHILLISATDKEGP